VVRYFMKPFNPIDLLESVNGLVMRGELDKDVSTVAI